jgi:hypothetical protein
MADISALYTLVTPAGNILFNNGTLAHGSTDDLYWLSDINGLDGAPLRAQIDNAPQAQGGIVHTIWRGARHVDMQGDIFIQSKPLGGACLPARNAMEEALREALESIQQIDGTLSWTPSGLTARSLTVRNDVPLDFSPANNYATMAFTFGLVAADPDW